MRVKKRIAATLAVAMDIAISVFPGAVVYAATLYEYYNTEAVRISKNPT